MLKKQLLLLIGLLTIFVGCVFDNSDKPLEREPFIEGQITQINEGHSSILVEEDPEVKEPSEPGGGKVWLTITDKTEVFVQKEDGSFEEINPKGLEVVNQVKGWVTGIVIDTYPGQGTAEQIVLIE